VKISLQDLYARHATAGRTAADALAGLTLDIAAGEQLAVIGPSGAGKTTLLEVLACARPPSQGALAVDGASPWALPRRALRALRGRLILVPQVPPLPPRQRVVTAVLAGRLPAWSLWKALRSLVYPADIPAAEAALQAFELGDKLFERVDRLSGGERQRQTAVLSTSAGALGATTLTFDASGSASTTLAYPAASNGSTVAAAARRCCPDGVSCGAANSCSTTFSTAGFFIAAAAGGNATPLPSQTAGQSSGNWVLRAVRSNSTTQACEAALSGPSAVNWSVQCNDPASCSAGNRMTVTGSSSVAVAGNANGSSSASTSVPMTFDANGNAPFSFSYADVGRVTLLASKPAGGTLLAPLSGSSNSFVVKPAGFVLSGIRCASYAPGACATSAIAAPGNNPAAGSAGGTAFLPAGKPFAATVTAVDANGNPTPNYGQEAAPEGVILNAGLVQPAGGNNPALSNASAFGSFSGGTASGSSFAWPEVGIITLTPAVADGNYLGAGNVTGTASGNVGRFYPAGFAVGGPSVTHRVDQACAAPSAFTYLDENFQLGFTLSAQNAAGATTENYTGSFARLDLGPPDFVLFVRTGERNHYVINVSAILTNINRTLTTTRVIKGV